MGWSEARVLLRCKRDPAHVLCMHSFGIYRIKIADGSHESVGGWGGWSELKEAVYDPESDCAFLFHSNGLYKVDPETGTYTAIKTGVMCGWACAHGAVYHPSGAFVFHDCGTFRVNLKD